MALEIRFLKDPKTGKVGYGRETVKPKNGPRQERINVSAELYDGERLLAVRVVQNIDPDDVKDRDAKVEAAFAGWKAGDEPEPKRVPLDPAKKTAGWSEKIASPKLAASID